MGKFTLTYRVCFRQCDEQEISNFLYTQKDELLLPDLKAANQVVELLFDKGGVIGGYGPDGKMQAMIGFLFGDPADGFMDKDLLFFYVLALAKPYRQARVFFKSMVTAFYEFQGLGLDQFRMQAGLTNRYINKLYSKIGSPIGESKTLRGQPVMTYAGSMDAVLSRYQARNPSIAH